jgi:hypothetical protein
MVITLVSTCDLTCTGSNDFDLAVGDEELFEDSTTTGCTTQVSTVEDGNEINLKDSTYNDPDDCLGSNGAEVFVDVDNDDDRIVYSFDSITEDFYVGFTLWFEEIPTTYKTVTVFVGGTTADWHWWVYYGRYSTGDGDLQIQYNGDTNCNNYDCFDGLSINTPYRVVVYYDYGDGSGTDATCRTYLYERSGGAWSQLTTFDSANYLEDTACDDANWDQIRMTNNDSGSATDYYYWVDCVKMVPLASGIAAARDCDG